MRQIIHNVHHKLTVYRKRPYNNWNWNLKFKKVINESFFLHLTGITNNKQINVSLRIGNNAIVTVIIIILHFSVVRNHPPECSHSFAAAYSDFGRTTHHIFMRY